jgi:transposase InsO family protein
MSLNSEDKGTGAMGAGDKLAHLQAPRLQSGGVGYAAWAANMDVFLQRAGAEGIHRKPMTEAAWVDMSRRVEEWAADALSAALALVAVDSSSSSSCSPKAEPLSAEIKEARRLVSATVERSRKVFGTLFAALPEELRAQVAHLASGWAYGLWHWLEGKFQSTEQDSVGELLAQWTTLRQEEGESFDAYRARVNTLHALLEQAKEKPSARMYAYMLLDRLQPRYKQAVLALKVGEQLKVADKIPWDSVTAFINAHERNESRLDAGGAEEVPSAKAMAARGSGSWADKVSPRQHSAAQKAFTPSPKPPREAQRSRPATLADVQCFNCEEFGHMSRNCSKPKKSRGGSPSGGSKTVGGAGGTRPLGAASAAVAPLKRVSAAIGSNRFEPLSDSDIDVDVEEDAALATPCQDSGNKGGGERAMAAPTGAAGAMDAALATTSWGVDSMASLHISGNKKLFATLERCAPVTVKMANSESVVTRHCGTVHIRIAAGGKAVRIPVPNVYYHERFSANLLSWNVLREEGWEMHSTKRTTFVQTPGGNRVALNTQGRVSVMDGASVSPERVLGAIDELAGTSIKSLVRLHERLGHVSFDRMVKLVKWGATLDLGRLNVSASELAQARERILQCPACAAGKGQRTAFGRRGLDRGSARGEVLHMDTFQVRLSHVPAGQADMEYGLTVTDPFTKWRWFQAVRSKDETAAKVIDIVRHAQTQLGCKVKRVYADGGTEFINQTLKAFFAKEGIELRYPPARTQQLNGISENAVRWTKDSTRTLLAHAALTTRFWAHAAKHSVYVWNRSVVSSLTEGRTPFETMYGKKPSAQHWGVFGCDALCHVPKEQRGASLAPKMEPCIYLGHDAVQNCALVFLLRTHKALPTRDVKFRLDSFTFAAALKAGDDSRVQAILDGDHEDFESDVAAASEQDEAAPQGGRSTPSDSEMKELEPDKFDVERITGQRRRRGGAEEYKVRWAGCDEETWEPARTMEEDAPEAVKEFLALQPPRAPPRQSPRLHPDAPEAGPADDGDPEPQVHMAMCAMKDMQSSTELLQQDEAAVACAVTAGVALLEEQTPPSFREAMAGPDAAKWRAATDKEMASCERLAVWDLVPRASLSRSANVLPPKWVFKIKTDESGALTEHKARVTPKGFRQKEGVDFFEVFARTGMYKSMRVGLSLTAKWDHELEQLDVPTAFLNADLEEEVYMELPEGYRQGREHLVCKLKKSLYGLKQAPRNWYLLVSKFIVVQLGFRATTSDPCLFFKRSRAGRLMLLFLFVDDFQGSFHRNDAAEWAELKAALVARFNTKDMGESKWILGMRIQRDRKLRTITLDQELYATKALEKYGLAECKVADTPEIVGAAHAEPREDQGQPADRQRFMEITGTLMYAAISTRPDIAHAVHHLASNMLAPTRAHMAAAERVLRYLAGTKDLGLVFGSRNGDVVGDSRGRGQLQVDVCAYSDADWANSKVDRKSVTGWVAKLNGDPVSWASKRQRTVALSTCEAELYAKAAAIQEVLWLRGLMKELGLRTHAGSTVHGDNQSAIAVAKNGVKSERTKHVDVKYHFITETVERGEVQLQWVSTHEQQADIFTKALPAPAFHQFRKQLMTR